MDTKYRYCNPEIWGGIECSINRVNNEYFDQFQFAGLYERKDLLTRVADLGISSLRFPILWEKHVTEENAVIDWSFTASSLEYLRSRNITAIAGLMHHGSGPAFTALDDQRFPELLAEYAGQVAMRFPDIQFYTPVNEPLTTARFSGLYGFWYPHKQDDRSFLNMLLNQVKATVLAMKAIRSINPDAKLIQTEDLAKTYSTQYLRYQADFENERRWLTYDLLCGRVDEEHALYHYFMENGITAAELQFFLDNPCPPDIMGFNYYITSERFLDDDLERYPAHMHGGNKVERYVDTEAVRVPHDQPSGLKVLMVEAWERYHIELSLTEVQLHCTREEQLRWFANAYEVCKELCDQGIPVRAVTAWSLLGAFGWNNLLRSKPEQYEPGVIDLRMNEPVESRLGSLIRSIAKDQPFDHVLLQQAGWWDRDIRVHSFLNEFTPYQRSLPASGRPVFIVGKTGTLGNAFTRLCALRNIPYKLLSRKEFNLLDFDQMQQMIMTEQPWAIVNAAGYVRVDDAESEIRQCMRSNTIGAVYLAELCKQYEISLVNFSSDLVFDGLASKPYTESSNARPLNVYGQSKLDMESMVLSILPTSLVVRTSAFFGPWDKHNFAWAVLSSLREQRCFRAIQDVFITPTYVPDLVNATLDLLIDGVSGIWHISHDQPVSWYDWAKMIAQKAGLDSDLVIPVSLDSLKLPARRPHYSALRSERGNMMSSLDHSMDRFVHHHRSYLQEELVHLTL